MTLRQYLQQRYSKSTLNSNLYHINRFTDYYQNKAAGATYKDVLHYMEHLRKNYELSPKTLRHCLYGVKIYFNYLQETGKRKDHPCSELYLKDKINRQIEVDNLYSPETLEHFFETYPIQKKTHLQSRNKIIIGLLIYQGLTVNEIVSLEVGHIHLEKGELFIKGNKATTSKSPRSRTLPLQAKQILLMHNYLKYDREKLLKLSGGATPKSIFILSQSAEKIKPHSISRIINENRKQSDKIRPLKIRQSVIANLLKKENNTRLVQSFAGHKRASTTAGYRQTGLEALKSALEGLHPLR